MKHKIKFRVTDADKKEQKFSVNLEQGSLFDFAETLPTLKMLDEEMKNVELPFIIKETKLTVNNPSNNPKIKINGTLIDSSSSELNIGDLITFGKFSIEILRVPEEKESGETKFIDINSQKQETSNQPIEYSNIKQPIETPVDQTYQPEQTVQPEQTMQPKQTVQPLEIVEKEDPKSEDIPPPVSQHQFTPVNSYNFEKTSKTFFNRFNDFRSKKFLAAASVSIIVVTIIGFGIVKKLTHSEPSAVDLAMEQQSPESLNREPASVANPPNEQSAQQTPPQMQNTESVPAESTQAAPTPDTSQPIQPSQETIQQNMQAETQPAAQPEEPQQEIAQQPPIQEEIKKPITTKKKESETKKSKDNKAAAALFQAIEKADLKKFKSILSKDKKLLNTKNKKGETPLILASKEGRLQIVKLILTKNPKINEIDENGMTAVMWATANKKKTIVTELLKHQPNLLIKNKKKRTALDIAKMVKSKELTALLAKKSTPTKKSPARTVAGKKSKKKAKK